MGIVAVDHVLARKRIATQAVLRANRAASVTLDAANTRSIR